MFILLQQGRTLCGEDVLALLQGAVLILELVTDIHERVNALLQPLELLFEHDIDVVGHSGNIEPRRRRINRCQGLNPTEMAQQYITWDHVKHRDCPAENLELAIGTMKYSVDQHELDSALRRCGSSWNASQAHGLACSWLALCGADALDGWLAQVLQDTVPNDALQQECAALLRRLLDDTHRQLAERGSEFKLLLPDEGESPAIRTEAMAQWCEGFLNGLVLRVQGDLLKKRLSAEPLDDIIRDMLEITRAEVNEDADDESTEVAFTEVQEYLRVAAQLVYEELAEFRRPPSTTNRVSNQVH